MRIPVVVLTVILVSVLLAVAIPKLTGQMQMRDRMTHLGVSSDITRLIGVLEVARPSSVCYSASSGRRRA